MRYFLYINKLIVNYNMTIFRHAISVLAVCRGTQAHSDNRLPGEGVDATSVNMFKNKIDNYFWKDPGMFRCGLRV